MFDPVNMADGTTYERITDFTIPGTVQPLSFTRTFGSGSLGGGGDAWDAEDVPWDFPAPFGQSHWQTGTLAWWHNFLSFVTVITSSQTVDVRTQDGELLTFNACSPAPCQAFPFFKYESIRHQLWWYGSAGFALYLDGGGVLTFGASYVGTRGQRYFLTQIQDAQSRTVATINYSTAVPSAGNCAPGLSGTSPAGTPYIDNIVTGDGVMLKFQYVSLPGSMGFSSCVISGISVAPPNNGPLDPLVAYAYTNSLAGLLATATWSPSSPSQAVVDSYNYSSGTVFDRTTPTASPWYFVHHVYLPTQGVVSQIGHSLDGTTGPSVFGTFTWPQTLGNCPSTPSTCCTNNTILTSSFADTSERPGDGTNNAFTMTHEVDVAPNEPGTHEWRVLQSIDTCSPTNSCANASRVGFDWQCQAAGAGTTYEPFSSAIQDKRGNWTVYTTVDAGNRQIPLFLMEERKVQWGAQDPTGTGALETYVFDSGYAPQVGSLSIQRPATKSFVGAGGALSTTAYNYDSSNRLTSEMLSSTSAVFGGNNWTLPTKIRAKFYFNAPSCATGQTDPLNRTLEVHGPCFVSSTTATDCPSSPVSPVTEFAYYETNSRFSACNTAIPATSLHRLCLVAQYAAGPSCSTPSPITWQFLQYDDRGNLLRLQDPNGVVTKFTYDANSDKVIQKDLIPTSGPTLTTLYTYDNGELSQIEYPSAVANSGNGLYEILCHRQNTEPALGCTATNPWSPHVQWRAKASMQSGSLGWTEAIAYTYAPDETVATEKYLFNTGPKTEIRRVVQSQRDGVERPTWKQFGDATGSFPATQSFDNNNNLSGVGLPYNSPPAWCAVSGGATGTSTLCTLLAYNRANRLGGIDQFPDGTQGSDTTTCIDRDFKGMVIGVTPGCSGGAAACGGMNVPGGLSSCVNSPSLNYGNDSFGNVLYQSLPWSGTTWRQFDAMGNVVVRQTAQMAANQQTEQYAYDGLGRLLSATSVPNSGGGTLLYSAIYDITANVFGCWSTSGTHGRLSSITDNFGLTAFSYDLEGRVVAEYRLRQGSTTCGQHLEDSPSTLYSYNADGVLTSITMPHYSTASGGRVVSYTIGPTDRPSAVKLQSWNGSTWSTPQAVISNVVWEPYGGLRGYWINHLMSSTWSTVEYRLGDNGSTFPGGGQGPPANCQFALANNLLAADHTGRVRSLAVSSGQLVFGGGPGDIYKVGYKWQGDQLVESDTCLLNSGNSGTPPRSETFSYDNMLRLKTAANTGQSTSGGAFASRAYSYSARSNLQTESIDGCNRTMTYNAAAGIDQLTQAGGCPNTGNILSYAYTMGGGLGLDGQATQKSWPHDSTGNPSWQHTYSYGETFDTPTESVFASALVGNRFPSAYNYYIDAFGNRRMKVYPAGQSDEFFHTLGGALLADQGINSQVSTSAYPEDDYVWLGGRPVAIIRGQFDTSWNRLSDATANCTRNSDGDGSGLTTPCGVYFPVTDYVGKVVLMLDSNRNIAGEADYDPYGQPNRVLVDAETAHPYPFDGKRHTVTAASQQFVNSSLSMKIRLRLPLVDTAVNGGIYSGCNGDSAAAYDMNVGGCGPGCGGNLLWYNGGAAFGQVISPWLATTSSAGKSNLELDLFVNAVHQAYGCFGGSCMCLPWNPSATYTGIIADAYEYQRYTTGGAPFWTPLRFAGHYYDPETDLFENWNRSYDPQVGRYLEPEPLLEEDPIAAVAYAKAGYTPHPYAYASNNPLNFSDRDGMVAVPNIVPLIMGPPGLVPDQSPSIAPLGHLPAPKHPENAGACEDKPTTKDGCMESCYKDYLFNRGQAYQSWPFEARIFPGVWAPRAEVERWQQNFDRFSKKMDAVLDIRKACEAQCEGLP